MTRAEALAILDDELARRPIPEDPRAELGLDEEAWTRLLARARGAIDRDRAIAPPSASPLRWIWVPALAIAGALVAWATRV